VAPIGEDKTMRREGKDAVIRVLTDFLTFHAKFNLHEKLIETTRNEKR
jgi:hypothetical protein